MKVWPALDDLRLGAYAKGLTGLVLLVGVAFRLRRVPLAVVEMAAAPLIIVAVAPQFLALLGLAGVVVAVTELLEARAVERWERSRGGRLVRFGAGFAVV